MLGQGQVKTRTLVAWGLGLRLGGRRLLLFALLDITMWTRGDVFLEPLSLLACAWVTGPWTSPRTCSQAHTLHQPRLP